MKKFNFYGEATLLVRSGYISRYYYNVVAYKVTEKNIILYFADNTTVRLPKRYYNVEEIEIKGVFKND